MFYRLQLGLNTKEKLKNMNHKKVSVCGDLERVLLEMKCNLVHSTDETVIIIMCTPHSLTLALVLIFLQFNRLFKGIWWEIWSSEGQG